MNVTNTGRKKGGHLQLGFALCFGKGQLGEHSERLVPVKCPFSIFFSDAQSAHKHIDLQRDMQTYKQTQYLQHLKYLVTGKRRRD